MNARLKRAVPWVIGLAIIVVLALRMPYQAFGRAIHEGPHVRLAALELAILIALLGTDTFATWVSLIAVRLRWSLRDVFAVRGATYVLALLNYAVGQGGLGYYLHRSGVSAARATGVTLFLIGTTTAGLLVTTTATWPLGAATVAPAGVWWMLVGGCIAFGLYLVVIAAAPSVLARREILAPLFEARVRGHLLTVVGRLPHVVIIVLGHWLAMLVWGFPVPFSLAIVTMPAVVVVTGLPVSPGGLGTTQAALVYFFSDFAPGATADERSAAVFAFAIVHFVYATVWQAVLGFACVPLTRTVQPVRSV